MTTWNEEYRAKVRAFIAEKGSMVAIELRGYPWEADDEVSPYSWRDYDSLHHIREDGCHWIVPEGAILYERSYSMFTDTESDNENQVGVNVKGCRCACGRYEDVILRWTGSVAEMLHTILGLSDGRIEVEL